MTKKLAIKKTWTHQEEVAIVEVLGGEIPEPLGQVLAEEDDVGPDDPAAVTVAALRDAVVAFCMSDIIKFLVIVSIFILDSS